MKKKFLFALLGGAILFVWQFLSFAFPNLHKEAGRYTPLQDTLLAVIARTGLEPGHYILGRPDPALESDRQKMEAEFKAKYEGKPWAVLHYQEKNTMEMGWKMVRGFIVDCFVALILFLVLEVLRPESLESRVGVAVAVGFMGFLFGPYTGYIWYNVPDVWAYMADGIIPWAFLGGLAHFLMRKKEANS
ncbi:MAG: hypothetical protein N2110_04690 [Flavobacteriales bacterium]|nr:hypothetical protein [Flavobacteriales bacterium]MCX7768306.1 hypothetical protein [Flavobacteriales bacterium]MDW8409934.1 hypothetical protein [Flavobacteriales bacterium]